MVRSKSALVAASLPLLHWQGADALTEEVMEAAQELGCAMFNPHVLTMEDGWLAGAGVPVRFLIPVQDKGSVQHS